MDRDAAKREAQEAKREADEAKAATDERKKAEEKAVLERIAVSCTLVCCAAPPHEFVRAFFLPNNTDRTLRVLPCCIRCISCVV